MRLFQLILKSGLTRNIEATGYTQGKQGVVIMLADGTHLRLKREDLLKIEEVHDEDHPLLEAMTADPVAA